jgi:Na+-transporting NADH:ubiquinone oxidoreductase subunit A
MIAKSSSASLRFKIRRGLDIPMAGAVQSSTIVDAHPVTRVALLGYDFVGVKRLPQIEVQVGDRVRLGQPLVRGKALTEVVGTAPGSGVVEAVYRGTRRALETVVIRLEGDDQETFNRYAPDELATLNRQQVRDNLLASGLWLSLRSRPFSMIADPHVVPDALFITAIDTRPLAPDPTVIIAQAAADFSDGVQILSKLTDGPVYVCTDDQAVISLPESARIRHACFTGPHPAGLVGTHIHLLRPADLQHPVWHLGYQDVIAIGRLFKTGLLNPERIVAFTGPMVTQPQLIRTRLGASTNELVEQSLIDTHHSVRVLSGSILDGRQAVGHTAFLGRFHNQISIIAEQQEREWLGWLKPGADKYSAQNVFTSSFKRHGQQFSLTTNQNGSPRAMVPIGAYERVTPLDILPTQLLRALVIDDMETAVALGALELDEEDLALCAFVDIGKHDFGPMLRRNLEKIWRENQ